MGLQRQFAAVFGLLFLIVALWGFVDGKVLIFQVNFWHNMLHLTTGIIGIIAGLVAKGEYAKTFNILFGMIYGSITVLGVMSLGGMLDINVADNILHLVVTVASLGVGFGSHD